MRGRRCSPKSDFPLTATAGGLLGRAQFRGSLALLSTRRFGMFCAATLLSNMGTWAQQVAEPWLLLTLGASSVLLGFDAFAAGAPALILTLFGGMLADRRDRRRIIAVFQSIQMLCPITLVPLLLIGDVRPWMVIVSSAVVGITDALSMPSFQSIVPSIVEREEIPAALALNSSQFNLSRILGPAVAGIVMAGVGAVGCFALNAASYIPFIGVALWIPPRHGARIAARDRSDRPQLLAGVRAIARDPLLRGGLLTVFVTSALCGPLITFAPVLVKLAFHRGVGSFSLAITSFGLGGLFGAIALLGVRATSDRRLIASAFAAVLGAVTAATALALWFWTVPVLVCSLAWR